MVYFADGIVSGSKNFVKDHLHDLRDKGVYARRKNSIECETIDCFVLSPQTDDASYMARVDLLMVPPRALQDGG